MAMAEKPTVQAMFGAKCPESGDKTMNIRSTHFAIVFLSVVGAFAAGTAVPPGFADAVVKGGKAYRDAAVAVTNDAKAAESLEEILLQEPADSANARQARILLARIRHPEVFVEFDSEIHKLREDEKSSKPYGERPGLFFRFLRWFVMRGPESKYVEEYVRDEGGTIVFEPRPSSNGEARLRGMYARRHRVERYTDAEVAAGIARNSAARQALLEHCLKFFDEGSAYEQGDLIWLVDGLWGRSRITRTRDLAVVDHVQDAEELIKAIFRDTSRHPAIRMRAALCLADDMQPEVRAFMLDVVTNTPPDNVYLQSEAMVNKALANLKYSAGADAATLDVLKMQTNGPIWKREMIEMAIRTITDRLSATHEDK